MASSPTETVGLYKMAHPHLWFDERAKVASHLPAANFVFAVIFNAEAILQRAKATCTFS